MTERHGQQPDRWVTGPPDYVGVGTARSGTGWWDHLISQHPSVFRPATRPGELHFFDELWSAGIDEQGVERYHAFFARPPGMMAGEWTPGYMLDAWTPALLRRAAPDARLLVLLRDPVERFRSGRTHTETRISAGPTARAAANASFNQGLYADQLLRLWRSYPRDQVLVLQYERCVADPGAELRRTYAFIGLAMDLPEGIDVDARVNESPGPKVPLSDWQADQLARHYAAENARLAELLPDLDLSLWRGPT